MLLLSPRRRLLLVAALAGTLTGCALPGFAALFGAAAPVVAAVAPVITAIDAALLARAQRLAPELSPARPDDAALLVEIARRLATLDTCDEAKAAALAPDAGPADATKAQTLIDLAAALRGLVDDLAAAHVADAGVEGGA